MPITARGSGRHFVSPGGQSLFASKAEAIRWFTLPYGVWTCPDGREVLFNRCYEPIRQRYPGQPPTEADPKEWVPWVHQAWFYRDGTRTKRAAGIAAMRDFEDGKPPKTLAPRP